MSEPTKPLPELFRDSARINRGAALNDPQNASAHNQAADVADAVADELETKDARIAELEARILELETVTDEDVERAAKAIAREAAMGTVDAWRDGGLDATVNWTWPRHLKEARAALSIRRGE